MCSIEHDHHHLRSLPASTILRRLPLSANVAMRCFPWMGFNFFLKDSLKVDSSTPQLLQNSANLPMVAKPIYGLLSDSIYIASQHRISYIAIGAFLQAVSWIAITILSSSNNSFFKIILYLLLWNFGALIVEVANDAIVAETGKQPSASSKNSQMSSLGELQSFVWIAFSIGGVLRNMLGGVAVDRFSPQAMFFLFGVILTMQFFITVLIRESSLNLPKSPSNVGIRKQLSELLVALRKPEIAHSITCNVALGVAYNQHLMSVPPKKLISAIQLTMAVFMVSDVLFVKGIYRRMGMPDSVYVLVFSGLLEVMCFFKILPFSVLVAQLCPPGYEGCLMAFLTSSTALAFIVSGYLGVALASYVGVTGNDFSGLSCGFIVQAACTLLPLFWSSCISDVPKTKRKGQ
ncbi:hypothetical protein TEA_028590 [Camellia sinensis var. sinensis]|uniref:Uncharacterized protein n=1 Tax=Camellia sinensis var. sinensis TaxID=542762 RepID=A0A4V3WQ92_CAMSN|nr:hypothetical protein TEA_028590 [Camellia sinensis var. sinensis]